MSDSTLLLLHTIGRGRVASPKMGEAKRRPCSLHNLGCGILLKMSLEFVGYL